MNMNKVPAFALALMLFCSTAQATPWSRNEGYMAKTAGKFGFGLKHSLFSWLFLWTEGHEPGYKKQWEGATVGVGKAVVYMGAGLIQLATFPIPADFPNVPIGLHYPNKKCPARHHELPAPPVPSPETLKTAAPPAPAQEQPNTEV